MSFNVQQFQLLQNETQKYKSQAAQADSKTNSLVAPLAVVAFLTRPHPCCVTRSPRPPPAPVPAVLRRRELEAMKQLQQAQVRSCSLARCSNSSCALTRIIETIQVALEQELIEANAEQGEEMRKLKHNQEVNCPVETFLVNNLCLHLSSNPRVTRSK